MKEYRDYSGRLIIELTKIYKYSEFLNYSENLLKLLSAELKKKLEGLDQNYYEYQVGDKVLVLHSDTFMGISIHFEEGSDDNELRSIGQRLISIDNLQ